MDNTSVNHNQYHQYFKGNYGLYFLVWDRLMGTIRNDNEQLFEEIAGRKNIEKVFTQEKLKTIKNNVAI